MKPKDDVPNWFLWMWEKGPYLFFGAGGLIAVTGIIAAVYLDGRLDKIENRLVYAPPRSYQPPNLENYQTKNVAPDELPIRQHVYVPVYSHVYYGGGSPCLLETTLSVRNIDLDQSVYLKSVEYFDTQGELVKTYLDQLIRLAPLQTIEFLIERRDSSGGSGANFMVQWMSKTGVDKPLVEAVMVGTAGTQGVSFRERGVEVSPPGTAK